MTVHATKIALSAIICQGENCASRVPQFRFMPHDLGMRSAKDIGHAIDTLRLERGLHKKELAAATGIDPGNLNRIISGKQWPTPERLDALTAYFGVKAWELFKIAEEGGIYETEKEDPRKAALKALIDRLDADALDDVFPRQRFPSGQPSVTDATQRRTA